MSDLSALESEIRARLERAAIENESRRQRLQSEMEESERRRERFEALAAQLTEHVIRPRMEKLAEHFENAEFVDLGGDSCTLRFQHTATYPASVRVGLAVSHDEDVRELLVYYELEVLPIFSRFEGNDHISLPIDGDSLERVATWVDRKIVEFVETYLGIQDTDQYQQGSLVTDPVCGMRFRKSIAFAEQRHGEETFWFCSSSCAAKFAENPGRYVHSR